MLVTKEIGIDTAHRVYGHKGKCRGWHGHRYTVEVGVDDKLISEGSSEGMVIDFGDLKQIMMEQIDAPLDHTAIYSTKDPSEPVLRVLEKDSPKPFVWVDFVPTAENIAEYIFYRMAGPLSEKGIQIKYVRIWETPSSTATYQVA